MRAESDVLPKAVVDHFLGVQNGGVVLAFEIICDLFQGKLGNEQVGQIHRDLAGKGDLGGVVL